MCVVRQIWYINIELLASGTVLGVAQCVLAARRSGRGTCM